MYFALSKEYALKVSDIQSTLEVLPLFYTICFNLCGCSISLKDSVTEIGISRLCKILATIHVFISQAKQNRPQKKNKLLCIFMKSEGTNN